MKKVLSAIWGLMLVISVTIGLASCGKDVEFNVNFVVDGEIYATVGTSGEETIKIPENPEKDGYIFDGWYWDNGTWQKPFTANSLLDAPLSSDMSAYAKFTPMLPSLTTAALSIDERNISGSFSYATEIFNFANDITVTNNSPWVVSTDIYGMQTVATKIAPLCEGNNTFYIHVTNPDKTVSTYTVNIYRNHLYTVNFNANGGTSVSTQYVEEGYLAEEPSTARAGYTFVSWDYNFDTPITSNITINANWNANENTPYKVEYYRQNLDKSGYELIASETETLAGKTDTTAYAEQKNFEHFTLNSYMSTLSGNINGNGDLILKVYYTRNIYSVGSENYSYGTVTASDSYAYGSIVQITATPNIGYDFIGWYSKGVLVSSELTVTCTIEGTITAKFAIKPEMANFNFWSTKTTCNISSIKDKTVTEIIVPDYVTDIFSGAFSGCTSLESIILPFVGAAKDGNENTHLGYIFGSRSSSSNDSYVPSSLKTVVITDSTSIGYSAFSNCSSLTSVTIPDSVTRIGGSAFSGCKGLAGITIPENVTSIGGSAFRNCTSLTSITIPDSVTNIGDSAFSGCYSLASVTIGNCVTTIGSGAFEYCTSLTSVTIPDSVTSIGYDAFYGCNKLVEVINKSYLHITAGSSDYGYVGYYAIGVHNGDSKIVNYNDYLFYTYNDINYLLGYVDTDTDLILPASYNSENYEIYEYAFSGCRSLMSVTIGDSVTSIGEMAFFGCRSLTSVTIGNCVTTIGSGAFEYCTSLTSMKIPDSVTIIGDYAFYGCNKLVEVINKSYLHITAGSSDYGYVGYYAIGVHNGDSKIVNYNDYLFYTYNGVNYLLGYVGNDAELILPDDYNGENYIIYHYAFYGNDKITSVTIPNNVTSIGEMAFYGCTSLTSVTIGNGVTSIGYFAFEYCTSLTSVTIGNAVTSIGYNAFSNCSSLTSVTIGNGVTSIGYNAFYNCSSLTSIKYRGSQQQWNSISKGEHWNQYDSNGYYYTINYTMTYNYTGE